MALATTSTIYPVYVYEEGMDLPKEGTYYVVAGNGLWMHKDTGLVRAFVPVKRISVLEDLNAEGEVECNLPKIPERLVWRVKEFFRRVVDKYRAESEVTLYYSKDKKDFKVHVPKQRVSHGSVHYERVGLTHLDGMADYLRVGTIHSHCDFGAFHSGTDHDDERDFDGLHITFGHNDRDEFTISASVVVNGLRKKTDPEDSLEGITHKSGDYYRLTPSVDPQQSDWAEGLDKWLSRVEGIGGFSRVPFLREPDAITKGCKVSWKKQSSETDFMGTFGEGPFEVLEYDEGKVTIKAIFGLARLSEKLFVKVGG